MLNLAGWVIPNQDFTATVFFKSNIYKIMLARATLTMADW